MEFKDTQLSTKNQYIGRADISLKIGPFSIKVVELLLNGFIAAIDDKIIYELIIFDPRY